MKHYAKITNKYIVAGGKILTVIITLAIYSAIAAIIIAVWLMFMIWLIHLFI